MQVKKVFIKQVEDFLEEISNLYPNIKTLQVFKVKYDMMKSMNSSKIIENFIKYIHPFKTQIMTEDELFFINGGGQDNIQGDMLKLRNIIRDLWIDNMSDENKKVVWKYFKVFILLSEKYKNEDKNIDHEHNHEAVQVEAY